MKALRLLRWSGSVLSPRTRPCLPVAHLLSASSRLQSTAAAALSTDHDDHNLSSESPPPPPPTFELHQLPSPPPYLASRSSRLAALHARLSLPPRFPIETLARCLVDSTADPNPAFNNSSLALLGSDILGYYTAEQILCQYPRLPMVIIFAAMKAYVGPGVLMSLVREWGIDVAAEPGGEVDPGFLQFKRVMPGNADPKRTGQLVKDQTGKTIKEPPIWNRGLSSLTVNENYFGEMTPRPPLPGTEAPPSVEKTGIPLEIASTNFVRALLGALHLHCGRSAAKSFFRAHFLSRQLSIEKLFEFRQPTRDLSRLCAREGFPSPVARILSETGRASRHPVFVVGVFSGRDKLGEGSGGSLDEARIRAAIGALKGWYLYSPLDVKVPSDVEDGVKGGKEWEPVLIDGGEVIV
jgi:dsRNA-specific ribonuclease